jgi:hypothetical protein
MSFLLGESGGKREGRGDTAGMHTHEDASNDVRKFARAPLLVVRRFHSSPLRRIIRR